MLFIRTTDTVWRAEKKNLARFGLCKPFFRWGAEVCALGQCVMKDSVLFSGTYVRSPQKDTELNHRYNWPHAFFFSPLRLTYFLIQKLNSLFSLTFPSNMSNFQITFTDKEFSVPKETKHPSNLNASILLFPTSTCEDVGRMLWRCEVCPSLKL